MQRDSYVVIFWVRLRRRFTKVGSKWLGYEKI
ncbi:hypothetical protein Gogos_019235 [Gossypium gossypioides]|uniref:Uncharacterized protein n=1 Tax=Gossypium gossypioides TaxID=34282 RepID=A0A7J9BGV7_GOSGO|nr:hypothetical protein [Gossypium gossypioides]